MPTSSRRKAGSTVAEGAPDLDRLALEAAGGDKRALGKLCRELQHPIYRLALRMLSDPHDAEDATQEVLVRIVTNLGSFEGRSRFMTWAYTVATRQLLRTRKRLVESSVRGRTPSPPRSTRAWGRRPTTSRARRSTRSCAPR